MAFGKILSQVLITSRPIGWIIFWISYLAGFLVSGRDFGWQNFIFLIILGPILSFPIYVFNDIYDFESDRINPRKKWQIMGGILSKEYWNLFTKLAYFCVVVIILTPIVLQSLFSLFLIILGLIIGIGYSVPPLRFKTKIGGDIIANTLGFGVLFSLGFGDFLNSSYFKYLIYSFFMVAAWSFLFSSIDFKFDKLVKHSTSTTKITQKTALAISAFGYFVSAWVTNLFFDSLSISLILYFCSFLIIITLTQNEKKLTKYLIFLSVIITLLSIIAYSWIYLPLI